MVFAFIDMLKHSSLFRWTSITLTTICVCVCVHAAPQPKDGQSIDRRQGPVNADPLWREGHRYQLGQVVRYQGKLFSALMTHVAWAGANWDPITSTVMWEPVVKSSPSKPEAAKTPAKSNRSRHAAPKSTPAGPFDVPTPESAPAFFTVLPQIIRFERYDSLTAYEPYQNQLTR